MKILYIYFTNNYEGFQGYNVHIKEFMENANKIDDIEVIGYRPLAVSNESQAEYLNKYHPIKKFVPRFVKDLLAFVSNFIEYRHAVKRIKEVKPDAIVFRQNFMNFYQILLQKRFKLPLLLEVNAPFTYERKKQKEVALTFLLWWTELASWKAADIVYTVSGELKNMLAEHISPDKIVPIHNGANIEDYEGLTKKKNDLLRIGFLGSFRKYHGIDVLFEVIPRILDKHDNVEFYFIGKGGSYDYYKSYFKDQPEYDRRVTMVGNVPYEDIPKELVNFDISMMLDFTEYGSPLKMFEYMMAKTAMVLPDRKTIREVLVDGEDVILFKPRDADDFERAVTTLINDNELRESMAQKGFEKVSSQYTWKHNAEKIINELRKIV